MLKAAIAEDQRIHEVSGLEPDETELQEMWAREQSESEDPEEETDPPRREEDDSDEDDSDEENNSSEETEEYEEFR